MKFNFSFFTVALFCFFGFAQENATKSPHYVLPEFVDGVLLMKDGTKQTGIFNYNALTESFALKKNDEILALKKSDQAKIDTVYIANRTFFRKDGTFLELLLKSEKTDVYLEYKCNLLSSTDASSGYGGTSQTTSGKSVIAIENQGHVYNLELPEAVKVKPYNTYWIKKDGVITEVKVLGQIKRLYKDRKKEIKTYSKTHNVDVNIPLSIVNLVKYLDK
jgi:hypothetical protein